LDRVGGSVLRCSVFETLNTIPVSFAVAGAGGLIVGSASPPKKIFELMTWESRLPPHSKIVQICVEDKTQDAAQSNKKQRRGVAI
jgi:hypothetical protein